MKSPFGTQPTQRSIRRFDQNASVGAIKRHTASEGFAKQGVCDRHLGRQDLGLDACFTGSYDIPQAERHELGVALDVGYQVEHFIGAVINPLLRLESRHLLPSQDDLAAQWRGEMAVVAA
ncbi:MAG TPA: hypothetical protein VGI23_15090 [Steroidobacteraceae bacterium]